MGATLFAMQPGRFALFGPTHLAMLAAVPLLAYLLSRFARRGPQWTYRVRVGLGIFLLANEAIWYWYRYSREGVRFPEGVPLQLCDLTLLLTGVAALSGSSWCFEFAYFAGAGGAALAMITPDLWAPWPSYPSIYYFLAHGGMIAAMLTLIWSKIAYPRPGAVWRAFAMVNVFALFVGIFNLIFETNYMYLCRKPANATLLDWFGPWPVYLLVGEVFALLLFWLMWLPFSRMRRLSAAHSMC